MIPNVANLWRHPIKSHGREALDTIALTAGQTIPWDRHWAILHDHSAYDTTNPVWAACQNFMLGSRTPGLAGLWATLDEATARVTLTHADLGTLDFAPDDGADHDRFLAWIAPLCPDTRARPAAIVHVPGRGMTDTEYPSVTLMSHASHRAVADRLDQPIGHERWRGNIWLDGLDPWAEWNWIGHNVQVGSAVLAVREPVRRCLHTAANPTTGIRDADTLGALRDGWGHTDFGVYAEVVQGGDVHLDDMAKVI